MTAPPAPGINFSRRARIDGNDPAQLGDDDLRLDVDQSDARIRVLVLDDEPQRGVQLLRSTQTGRRPADAVVEHLALEDAERVEQFTLGGEPAVQRRPGDPGLQCHLRKTQLRLTTATEHFCGRDEDPVPRRGVLNASGCVA